MLSGITSYFWPATPAVKKSAIAEDCKDTAVVIKSTQQVADVRPIVSLVSATKQDPQALYDARLADYKKATQGLSSLFKHILYVLDEKSCSSPSSIAKILKSMGSSAADFKGFAIHTFNSGHRGGGSGCPFFKTTSLKPSLHLGTTRIWNEDGSVNEERWKKLIDTAAEENKTIITIGKLHTYLAQCANDDPEEKETGRHTSPLVPFSKSVQVEAAYLAWNEVFDRLACGWKKDDKTGDVQPYLSVQVVREFFDDSPAAYLRAECGLLPVAKPKVEQVVSPKHSVSH